MLINLEAKSVRVNFLIMHNLFIQFIQKLDSQLFDHPFQKTPANAINKLAPSVF